MSGKVHHRFINQDRIADDLGNDALELFTPKSDQLRSASSAKRSMLHKLNSDTFYDQFEPCIRGKGSDHAIEVPCGRLRESAACLICRQRARHHIIDYILKSGHFTNNAQMVTVLDSQNRRAIYDILGYKPIYFLKDIQRTANLFREGMKAVGFFEVGLVGGVSQRDEPIREYWSNHCHLIIEGPQSGKFLETCAETFSDAPKQVVASPVRGSLARMLCYVTKSPYSRRQWKRQPTGSERLLLDKFYHSFDLSDLFWTSSNIRFSGNRRIQISPLRDIAVAQILASRPSSILSHPALRIVPKAPDEAIQAAATILENLNGKSIRELERGLLSSEIATNVPWKVCEHLIRIRLRSFDDLTVLRKGTAKSLQALTSERLYSSLYEN